MNLKLLKIAGIINLIVAFLHTVGGQITDIIPFLKSNLSDLPKTEILGAWHMVTITLFATSVIILKMAFKKQEPNKELLKFIGYLYVFYAVAFTLVSVFQQVFVPQAIMLLPVGLLLLKAIKK